MRAGTPRAAHRQTDRDAPDENADEVRVHHGAYGVVDDLLEQISKYFRDALRGAHGDISCLQRQCRGKESAQHHGKKRRTQRADQIENDNRPELSVMALALVCQRGCNQHEHKDRCDSCHQTYVENNPFCSNQQVVMVK